MRTKKVIKYVPFSSTLALNYFKDFSFQLQDEGFVLDVTMWEELLYLDLERALPMAVALSLSSQSLSVPHPMMEFRTSHG